MTMTEPKSPEMRALYWRDEILQVMFWLRGEGFGDQVDPRLLERFLGVDADVGITYLDRMVQDGFLILDDQGRYELTDIGRTEGARIFSDAFADLTRPSHGECGDDCWCHASLDEAEICAQERAHAHDHEH